MVSTGRYYYNSKYFRCDTYTISKLEEYANRSFMNLQFLEEVEDSMTVFSDLDDILYIKKWFLCRNYNFRR